MTGPGSAAPVAPEGADPHYRGGPRRGTSMPHDTEAERAILGAVLLDNQALAGAAETVTADDFFAEQNRFIFEGMTALFARGEPIDEVTLKAELEKADAFQRAGGGAYISSLIDGLPSAANVEKYARIINDKAARRTLIRANAASIERAQGHDPLAEIVERQQGQLAALAAPATAGQFEAVGEGQYLSALPGAGVVLEADYLRRENGHLKAELLVRCELAGARTVDGVLAVSDVNLSSTRERQAHARYLGDRARVDGLDWTGILEEFAQRVLAAERRGEPPVLLSELSRPEPDNSFEVAGVELLERHPSIWFGDGGTAKSYFALYVSGELVRRGHRVGFFDWELAGEDHRDRLERLFGPEMPTVYYARCSRPLIYEADRIRRIVREQELTFAIFDSIAFACDGPPEAAEVAGRYFQALRQIGTIGSLHLAHVTKALEGADRRPFGSAFWHNGARATWAVKLAAGSPGDDEITIGLYHRKANLGPLRPAVGIKFIFLPDETLVRTTDLADVEDLAASMSIPERIRGLLKRGAVTRDELAAELEDVKASTLRSAVHRGIKGGQIVAFPGPAGAELIGLPERSGR